MLGLFFTSKRTEQATYRRILIANGGRLGDLVVTSLLISDLKNKHPGAEIYLLVDSSCEKFVQSLTDINGYILTSHWFFRKNRGIKGLLRYCFSDLPDLVRELKRYHFDLAVDVRYAYPNAAIPLYLAGIPQRFGFRRVGCSPLYSWSIPFEYQSLHELEYQYQLFGPLGLKYDSGTQLQTNVKCEPLADEYGLPSGERYCVLHVAGTSPTKDVPTALWQRVIDFLLDQGIRPVITGNGPRDDAIANELSRDDGRVTNLVGKLSFSQLAAIVGSATLVVSVDTFTGHLAGALQRPVVSLFGGFNDHNQWRPHGGRTLVVTNQLSCSPCFNHRGCQHNDCINGISFDDVAAAIRQALGQSKTETPGPQRLSPTPRP